MAYETLLHSYCIDLYKLIYNDDNFNIDEYWNAYLLRANDPLLNKKDSEPSSYAYYAISSNPIIPDKPDDKVNALYNLYLYDKSVRLLGDVPFEIKYKEWIIDVATTIQEKMRGLLIEKGVSVECAPTSNLFIGQFNRYDEHPMLAMSPVDDSKEQMSISINTDDSGILATSLYAEYSLIALSLIKSGYNEKEVFEYIDHLRENSNSQRFK